LLLLLGRFGFIPLLFLFLLLWIGGSAYEQEQESCADRQFHYSLQYNAKGYGTGRPRHFQA
jgi:hypothetical protein